VCVTTSSFAAITCCEDTVASHLREDTVASHLLAATVYKVPLPSRQPLAPLPLFAGAFPLEGILFVVPSTGAFPLEGFSLLSLFCWYLLWLEGFCCCSVLQFSFRQFVVGVFINSICGPPWQNNLPNIMIDDHNP
jgi:hypothetical protein